MLSIVFSIFLKNVKIKNIIKSEAQNNEKIKWGVIGIAGIARSCIFIEKCETH